MPKNPTTLLKDGLEKMGLSLSTDVQEKLLTYLELMLKWNQRMNLTGHQSLDKMIPYHLLDSLSVLPLLKGKEICDVGTGAGLPGIPLAIADPTRHYTLVDARLKRVQFLRTVCRELKLTHVTPVAERIEKLQLKQPADTVIARAVSQTNKLIQLTEHLIAEGGQWLFMKGQDPSEEIETLKKSHRVEKLTVPGVDGERCVIVIL